MIRNRQGLAWAPAHWLRVLTVPRLFVAVALSRLTLRHTSSANKTRNSIGAGRVWTREFDTQIGGGTLPGGAAVATQDRPLSLPGTIKLMLALGKDHRSAASGGSFALYRLPFAFSICVCIRHGDEGPVTLADTGVGVSARGQPRLPSRHLRSADASARGIFFSANGFLARMGVGSGHGLRRDGVLNHHDTSVGNDELPICVGAAGHDLSGFLERHS